MMVAYLLYGLAALILVWSVKKNIIDPRRKLKQPSPVDELLDQLERAIPDKMDMIKTDGEHYKRSQAHFFGGKVTISARGGEYYDKARNNFVTCVPVLKFNNVRIDLTDAQENRVDRLVRESIARLALEAETSYLLCEPTKEKKTCNS